MLAARFKHVDWVLLIAILPLVGAGLITMNSFTAESYFFGRQLAWVAVSLVVFFLLSLLDLRFLRRSGVVVAIYACLAALLLALLFIASPVKGARSWFNFGPISFQPADFMKLALILILAKYFSRRHIAIAHFRHIFVSGLYALLPFALVFVQPDFGSAVIIFVIWLGMIIVAGVSRRHLALVLMVVTLALSFAWFRVLDDYQKIRLASFVNPLADVRGAGYNARQSTIAVGSGQVLGKGVGHGTQSRLRFLPEYETDFIFAAFAEEWGFVGVIILLALFNVVIWRTLEAAKLAASNFEALYAVGLAILFLSHLVINVGMNIGLLPVTGLPLPFVSYGGSHLLAAFIGLGLLMGMRRYSRAYHQDDLKKEFLGV
ncbi:MAG: rod shape-determining protein RodA [Patescibacteria group bacterium]